MSISCTALRSAILTYFSPGDAVRPIVLNFAWTERHCHACKTPRSMYPSIYNYFPVIRTTIAKNAIFTYPGLHFLFALGTPLWQSRKSLHEWKENSVLAKALAACTYLSLIVSELYDALSQCVIPKIAIFITFLFPLGTPLGLSR